MQHLLFYYIYFIHAAEIIYVYCVYIYIYDENNIYNGIHKYIVFKDLFSYFRKRERQHTRVWGRAEA